MEGQVCSRCIYDESVSEIKFDSNGMCNYCRQIDELKLKFGTGTALGEQNLKKIIHEIKRTGRGKKYDCIIGVSGGTDSSYMMHLATSEWGLRPLAVHYDNTWNSSIASMNIEKVLRGCAVDLKTHVVDNLEADDIFKSFFLAGVAEIEASTDLAYAYIMRQIAAKLSIKFVLEGHSFVEEGITPLGRNYFDGRYIKSIHRRFGSLPMKTYPLMTFNRFLYVSLIKRIKFIRPFWYINYSKKHAQEKLAKLYDWKYYGGHHLENRMTAFYHSHYLPKKFKTDLRLNSLSAKVRNKYIDRQLAIDEYQDAPYSEKGLEDYFKKRLNITDCDYDRIMNQDPVSWQTFPTYKRRFEMLEPLFRILAKNNYVPMAFYLKYCKKSRA